MSAAAPALPGLVEGHPQTAGGAALPAASAEPAKAAPPSYFQTGWTGGKNPWAIALVVTMATFMEVLDTSIANVSLPHIAGDLSVSMDESTWVLTSYLVANAIVLPISGWLASRYGRKRFYMTCVALFTVSSFLCGMAPSLPWLVFFRILQGVGGGGLGPSEQSILADTFPPQKRGQAFAIYGMAVVLAPAIGPTLGGFITDHFSWNWVFYINVPVGILSMILTSRMVTDPPHVEAAVKRAAAGQGGSIDFVGLGLIAVGLGSLELVLDKGQEDDWFHSNFIVGCSLVAAAMLTSFVVWEWRHPHPIVDIRLFRDRNFATANLMMMVLGVALFGTTVLLPQFTQIMMGYSAQDAGMALSPGGFTVMLLMPLVGNMIGRVDARKMLFFGFSVLSLSLFYMSNTLYTGLDFNAVIKLRVYQSVGLAFMFVPINTLSYVGIPQERTNSVSGIVNLSRNMGGDIGIALVTTLLARRSQVHQATLSAYADPFHAAYDNRVTGIARALAAKGTPMADANHKAMGVVYRTLQQQAMALSYTDVLFIMGCGTMCMLPLLLLLKKNTGKAQMGH
jgi:DHA2 family multidrug resistance protein